MNLNHFNCYRLLLIRQLSLSSINKTRKSLNHYDALGITKHATQADIKSAYYKLSMIYHPDKNPNTSNNDNNDDNIGNSVESSQKFRDITEAYKILSNVKTRKLYDRGLLINNNYYKTTSTASQEDIENKSKFYQSRDRRTRAPPTTTTGRTVVYDFDEWTRVHYGATFKRDMENKERRQRQEHFHRIRMDDIKTERMLMIIGAVLIFFMLVFHKRHDADIVRTKRD